MSTTRAPLVCPECSLQFSGRKKLRKHIREAHSTSTAICNICSLDFTGNKKLRQHKLEAHPAAPTCAICSLTFPDKKILKKHRKELHPRCKYCNQKNAGLEELRHHQQETRHLYCPDCDIYFLGHSEHILHVRNVQHTTQYYCCDCDREYSDKESLNNHCCNCDKSFISPQKLTQHVTNRSHILKATAQGAEISKQQLNKNLAHKCKVCSKGFSKKKALNKHMSSEHGPIRQIQCPVGHSCTKKFATPSALLNHLESGQCRSGMTRTKMAELVFTNDPNRYITSLNVADILAQESVSQDLNTSTSVLIIPKDYSQREEAPFSPATNNEHTASDGPIMDVISLSHSISEVASDWSLVHSLPPTPDNISQNGSEWSFASRDLATATWEISASDVDDFGSISEVASLHGLRCYLCPAKRKPFGSVGAYQAHVASAAHAPKLFHCPLSFMPDIKPEDLLKRRSFSTLGGLTQHLETGGCTGGVELYRRAIRFVEEQLECLGHGGIRLLSV